MSVSGSEKMTVGLPLLCLFAFAHAVPSPWRALPCLACLLNYHSSSLDVSYDTILIITALLVMGSFCRSGN